MFRCPLALHSARPPPCLRIWNCNVVYASHVDYLSQEIATNMTEAKVSLFYKEHIRDYEERQIPESTQSYRRKRRAENANLQVKTKFIFFYGFTFKLWKIYANHTLPTDSLGAFRFTAWKFILNLKDDYLCRNWINDFVSKIIQNIKKFFIVASCVENILMNYSKILSFTI